MLISPPKRPNSRELGRNAAFKSPRTQTTPQQMAALRVPLRAILSRAAPPSARLLLPLHAHLVVSGRLAASPAALTSLVSLYARAPAALRPAIPLLLAPSDPLPCYNA